MAFDRPFSQGDENAYMNHEGKLDERPLAVCYRIKGKKVWIQKRFIRDANERILVLPKWLATSKKMESDF
jgi:hypothetical protein